MPAIDQGVTRNRYSLIPRTLIFLFHGNELLLIKGAPDKKLWANLYNGIGGHVERGENLLASARRELFEETGLSATKLWLCGLITVDPGGDPGVCVFIMKGECIGGTPIPSNEGKLQWVPVTEVSRLPLVEDLYALLPIVIRAHHSDPPFIGNYWYSADDRLMIHLE